MKKFLKARKAKGFTLVELLIVLIIIGILAGALLLVAGAGTDKANATKIVSNLRSLKAAGLMYYADSNSAYPSTISPDLVKYMESGLVPADYVLKSFDLSDGKGTRLFVGYYKSTGSILTGNVWEKLNQLRLTGVPVYPGTGGTAIASTDFTSTSNTAWMGIQ